MAIQPFNYQKRTNIEEHNQIVDKLNEVVDAVNNIDPNPSEFEQRIDALEQSAINQQNAIDGIHTRDALQDTEISSIKGKVTVNTNNIEQLETDTTNLEGRVTDIDGRLTTLAGNYTTLGGRVDSINTEVGQLSTEIGGLETGKVNVAQGTENNGKYLGVGEDGNVTLKEIVIPEGKTYKLSSSRNVYSKVPSAPTTITVNGIEYARYYGALTAGSSFVYTDIDIAKVVFNDTDAYCGSLYYQKDTSSGPDPDYKTMGDAGILYDVLSYGNNIWYTIMVPTDLYETINLTKIYITLNAISLAVV